MFRSCTYALLQVILTDQVYRSSIAVTGGGDSGIIGLLMCSRSLSRKSLHALTRLLVSNQVVSTFEMTRSCISVEISWDEEDGYYIPGLGASFVISKAIYISPKRYLCSTTRSSDMISAASTTVALGERAGFRNFSELVAGLTDISVAFPEFLKQKRRPSPQVWPRSPFVPFIEPAL